MLVRQMPLDADYCTVVVGVCDTKQAACRRAR
jgi:hypothetical protein